MDSTLIQPKIEIEESEWQNSDPLEMPEKLPDVQEPLNNSEAECQEIQPKFKCPECD